MLVGEACCQAVHYTGEKVETFTNALEPQMDFPIFESVFCDYFSGF